MNSEINFDVVLEFPNGSIYEFITDSNQKFEVFIPCDYKADTSVILYEHSDGGYFNDWKCFLDKFSIGECNSIIIRADRRNSVEWYNLVKKECCLKNNVVINVSFNGGAVYSLRETATMINNDSSIIPVSILLDGYVPVDSLKNDGVIDTLKNNNAIVLAFCGIDSVYRKYYESLAISGVNTIIFSDKSSLGVSHTLINSSYIQNGLYEYSIGDGDLPDRYDICVYDFEKKEFISINYSDISNISKVYNYFSKNEGTETDSLIDLLSSFSAQIKYLDLKNNNYNGNELSIKPKAVEFVINYLDEILANDLKDKLAMTKISNESTNFSVVESIVLNAIEKCRVAANRIRDIKDSIINYGNDSYTDNDINILNEFLGIKGKVEENIIASFYNDINIDDDDNDEYDDFEFLEEDTVSENNDISTTVEADLSNNVLYWMNKNTKFSFVDNIFDDEEIEQQNVNNGAVSVEDGHLNIFSAALKDDYY